VVLFAATTVVALLQPADAKIHATRVALLLLAAVAKILADATRVASSSKAQAVAAKIHATRAALLLLAADAKLLILAATKA